MDPLTRAQTENSPLARFGDKLQQWPKGVSGNPGGRPKSARITKMYRRILAKAENRKDFEETIVGIIKGDSRMAAVMLLREMAERTEGKITQSVELSGTVNNMTAEEVDDRLKKLLGIEQPPIDVSPTNESTVVPDTTK